MYSAGFGPGEGTEKLQKKLLLCLDSFIPHEECAKHIGTVHSQCFDLLQPFGTFIVGIQLQ